MQTTHEKLLSQIDQQSWKIGFLENRVAELTAALYGKSSEKRKSESPLDRSIFNEIEQDIVDDQAEDDKTPVKNHTRRRGKRSSLPKWLPRVRQEIDLLDVDKKCATHGVDLVKIGEEKSEKLEFIPATTRVIERCILKYKCPCCEEEELSTKIFEAKPVVDLIPKSFATPSLLAYIAISKYEDSLPLARQEKTFARYGIHLSRTTMARWMIKVWEGCRGLLNLMHSDLIASPVLYCDETRVQVLKELNRLAEQHSYMWVLARPGESPIILFRYHERRNSEAALDLLEGFCGTLITDGYKVYDSISKKLQYTLAGCMAHCRRKFFLAEKLAKKSAKAKERILASEAMAYIQALYRLERQFKALDDDSRRKRRVVESQAILDQFHEWLLNQENHVVPSSPTGKAISYAVSQWKKLSVFVNNGAVNIDNNYVEGKIKAFVIGRKNWLFASSPAGADASAALYSLIETAKANGLCANTYLTHLFKELPYATLHEHLQSLLPYNVKL